jgi:hypothetical protein
MRVNIAPLAAGIRWSFENIVAPCDREAYYIYKF